LKTAQAVLVKVCSWFKKSLFYQKQDREMKIRVKKPVVVLFVQLVKIILFVLSETGWRSEN
jgi:hypothetical protein